MTKFRAGANALVYWLRELRAQSKRPLSTSAPAAPGLGTARIQTLIADVRRDGVVAIPDYWPAERCARARAEIDRAVTEYPQAVQGRSKGSDKRMYGVEEVSETLMEFHTDPFLRGFGEMLGGSTIYNFSTLGARIEANPDNTGSGDGWHRDAHGFQFKSIIYLSDTGMDNGPFQYLIGSHRLMRVVADSVRANVDDPRQSRFTDTQVAQISDNRAELRTFPAKAGTLLLVNTAGIHRGMPLVAGERYALTNYYYPPDQITEDRLLQFSPLVPGMAERVRREVLAAA